MNVPPILSSDRLTIYLNDHLGGAAFGVELARRAEASNRGNEFGPRIARLRTAIEDDRRALEQIITRVGRARDRVKPAAGWLLEKAGRLKLNGQLVGYSPLSRLVELEGLTGGVHAKLSLWQALAAIAPAEPRLSAAELERLAHRAEEQLEELRALRIEAARLALLPSPS